jgi:hypothetical protein
VLSGELAHQDSMGNVTGIPPGDVQRMSAGTGVMHSEFNHAQDQTTHFLQIWIEPDQRGIPPGYEQRSIAPADKRGKLRLVASSDGRQASVRIHADAYLYAGEFDADEAASLALNPARKGYAFLIKGSLTVNGHSLNAGDALLMEGEAELSVSKGHEAELMFFDLAP